MKYIFIYLLLICIILFFSYYNSIHHEAFTPHIRRLYRPYVRHARKLTESFYNQSNQHINRILRNTGLKK